MGTLAARFEGRQQVGLFEVWLTFGFIFPASAASISILRFLSAHTQHLPQLTQTALKLSFTPRFRFLSVAISTSRKL
jgi:hypothetical protein